MNATILVVEDDRSMRDGLRVTLELEGYNVLTATDGQKAIRCLETSAPDLIVADVKMPHMDGLTFLTKVRENEAWQDIPIIMVTAAADAETKTTAKWRGAQAYMTKPFDLEDLLATVIRVLAQGQTDEKV
jgi:DNA-binding response OmpR family regulator